MKKLTRMTLVLLLSVGLVLSGCVSTPAGIAPSTKPLKAGGYVEMGPAKGQAFGMVILGVPITELDPARTATDRAIENGGGDAMVNITVDQTVLNLFVVTLIWTNVHGTGVQSN